MIRASRLDNGLRVVTEPIPHAISVSAGLWVLRGSRSEPAEWCGITHFVEHLLFKGTRTRSALDISREIESVGGSLNAFTGKEFMCLHARTLHDHTALAMELIGDIFLHASLPEEEIEREREVILQEIHMVEDTAEELIHELFAASFWREHPLGRPTLGTKEVVGRLDRKSLKAYGELLRDPGRVLLTASGRLEHERIVELAERYLCFPESNGGELTTEKPSPHKGLHLHLKDLEQAHLCLGTLGYEYSHPRRYGFHVLNTMLGGGMSSRLFQEIREKRGLAYAVYSFQASYADTGLLGVYVGTGRGHVPEVVDLLKENLARLRNEQISETELKTAKEQLKGNLLLSTESTGSRMSKLAMNEIFFGRQLDISDVIRDIDKVGLDEVQAISQELFRPEYMSLTLLGDIERDRLADVSLDF